MNSLYGKKLPKDFDKMYQSFIDYTIEYKFYGHYANHKTPRPFSKLDVEQEIWQQDFQEIFKTMLVWTIARTCSLW